LLVFSTVISFDEQHHQPRQPARMMINGGDYVLVAGRLYQQEHD
jgi:hypothetical protein